MTKLPAVLMLMATLPCGLLTAQDSPGPTPPPSPTSQGSDPTLVTLRGLIDSTNALREEQSAARRQLEDLKAAGADAAEIQTVTDKLKRISNELGSLRLKFEELSAGTSEAALESGIAEPTQLGDELRILLEPMIYELRKSTEKPREIERLRTQVTQYERQRELADASLIRLDSLLKRATNPVVRGELEKLKRNWLARQARIKSELEAATLQLENTLEKQESLFALIGNFLSDFLARRGTSFALAVLGGVATFCLLGLLLRIGFRVLPDNDDLRRSLTFRVARLVLLTMATILAVFAFLGVLYSQSDWLLLGLSLIFILGMLWAAKQALLPFYEQLKTVLNLGPVREGERVIFDGIPWEVKTINFYTDLVNPMLTGGHVRVALADLTKLHSRPKARKEPLFPCGAGDWVQLSDGTYGEVLSQTPELVRLRTVAGSVVSYQTSAFLGLAPDNHSETFGVRVPVGIDYQHQAICTTDVREKLEVFIKARLQALIGAENIKGFWVEFSGAGASSLDYTVGVTIDGTIANRRPSIARAVQRLFVDACNEYGWVIPFTQVTIHQAA